MKETAFPPEWGEERVRRALTHYEPQTREKPVGPNIIRADQRLSAKAGHENR